MQISWQNYKKILKLVYELCPNFIFPNSVKWLLKFGVWICLDFRGVWERVFEPKVT
jgi:hypothetical protein